MARLLDLRVEVTTPLREAYGEVIEAMDYGYQTTFQQESLDAPERRALDEHRRAALRAFAVFAVAARAVVGVQFERD